MTIDEGCVEGLKRGDAAAFERLVETYEAPLFRFFYVECRDGDAAEEQSSETFARLVRGLPNMRGGAESLRAFVFSTARHVRSGYRRRVSRNPASLDAASEVAGTEGTPLQGLARTEEAQGLLRALDRLAADARRIVVLRYMENLSLGEIAEALDLPVGTVKSHLHRGKRRLKRILTEMGCEP